MSFEIDLKTSRKGGWVLLSKLGFLVVAVLGGAIGGRLTADSTRAVADTPIVPLSRISNVENVSSSLVSSSNDLTTTAISPARIVDTREGTFAYGGTKAPWGAEETRTVQGSGLASIPSNAVGLVLNITALNATSSDTFITIFPTNEKRPEASTLNPMPNEVSFNAATTLLQNGSFDVYNYSGTLDLIIDVTAYMTDSLSEDVSRLQTGERLFPLKPIAGVTYGLAGDTYSDWRNYSAGDPDGFFGAPVEPGRYSNNAEVVMEVGISPIQWDLKVCFRINSSTDGPIEESEVCADQNTPATAAGVVFLTSPRVHLPSGTLTVHAKVFKGPTISTCTYMNCSASMTYFGFRTFDD